MNDVALAPLAVSRRQAGEMLSVCEATISNLIRKGKLKACRVGDRIIVPITELERYLRDHPAVQKTK
jgi:excisionase family DNA binding protein